MKKYKVLLVEDDIDLGNVLKQFLEFGVFAVTHSRNGAEGLRAIEKDDFDVAILDVMMTGTDGFELASALKKTRPGCPFLFLTAKGLKEDRIRGLSLGADDYIVKPFEPDELVLRIRNILSRSGRMEKEIYSAASYELDYNSLLLRREGSALILTVKEAQLLKLLIENLGTVVSRTDILEKLWGSDDYFLGRSLDVFISRLRKYLSDDPLVSIETVRGLGFVLRVQSGPCSKVHPD